MDILDAVRCACQGWSRQHRQYWQMCSRLLCTQQCHVAGSEELTRHLVPGLLCSYICMAQTVLRLYAWNAYRRAVC